MRSVNLSLHKADEIPFLDIAVYHRRVDKDHSADDDGVLVFFKIKGDDKIYSDVMTVMAEYDEETPSYRWAYYQLTCTKNGTKPEDIEIVYWTELPTEEVKKMTPVSYTWINDKDADGNTVYRCARCLEKQTSMTHYCPYCGENMNKLAYPQ